MYIRRWMIRFLGVSEMSDCYCQHDCFEMYEEQDGFNMWQGLVGPYYLPHVDEYGNIYWTNNGGLPNPAAQNITGNGIKPLGIVATAGDLPESANPNDAYLVGTEVPYHMYYYASGTWVDIGLALGPVPDLQIGTVETGPAGSQAEATITGTPEHPLLNLKIPKGDKGDAATAEADILDVDTGKTWKVSQSVVNGFLVETITEVEE